MENKPRTMTEVMLEQQNKESQVLCWLEAIEVIRFYASPNPWIDAVSAGDHQTQTAQDFLKKWGLDRGKG